MIARNVRCWSRCLLGGGVALAFWATPGRTAFEDVARGVRAAGLGGAYVAVADDAEAMYWNPAALRLLPGGETSAEIGRPFGLEQADQLAFAWVQPTVAGSMGLAMSSTGENDYYRESVLRFAFSRDVGRHLLLGASASVLSIDIQPTYGADWAPGLDLGAMWRFDHRLRVAAALRNLNRPALADGEVRQRMAGRLGIAFDAEVGVLVGVDLALEENLPARLHVGQEIRVHSMLALRAGLEFAAGSVDENTTAAPPRYSLGFGAGGSRMRVDYAFVDHPNLDGTHRVGITVRYGAPLPEEPARFRSSGSGRKLLPDRPMDLNEVQLNDLVRLPGIGPSSGARILAYRAEHGIFLSIDDLLQVSGLGPRAVEKIRPYLFVRPTGPPGGE